MESSANNPLASCRKTADNVARAIIDLLSPIAHRVQTLTSDNGQEFAAHERFARALNTEFLLYNNLKTRDKHCYE